MKKIMIMLVAMFAIIGFTVNPVNVNAEVKVMDLTETLQDKGITPAFNDYKETDKQVKVYLFRWANCGHCYDFLEYLNSITKDYGYMFKLRSYETSMNEDNEAVYAKVGKYFNHTGNGVPFIVIGDKYIYGFGEDSKEEFISYLKAEYEKTKRFDVFEEMDKVNEEKEKKESKNNIKLIAFIVPTLLTLVSGIILLAVKTKD